MNRKKISRLAALLLVLSLWLTALAGCAGPQGPDTSVPHSQSSSSQETVPSPLSITIPDTGKSDCILLKWADAAVLIDTGAKKNEETILAMLEEQQVERLDLLILSHLDKDHVGCADKILESIPVERILQPDYQRNSKQEEEYLDAAQKADITPERLTDPVTLTIGGCDIQIVPGKEAVYEQSNDYSLIVTVICGTQRFLFAGDAEKIRLSEFLSDSDASEPYALVKMPHHGGYEDNLPLFLAAVDPRYAVITCSEKDPADSRTLSLLEGLGIETLQTVNGTVRIQTDGTTTQAIQDAKA